MRLKEVTQRKLECYQRELLERGDGIRAAATYNRIVIEAAAVSGIAEGAPDDVGDLSPRAVREMTERILKHVLEAQQPLTGEA